MYEAETLFTWNIKVHFHGYSVFDKNIPFQSRFLIVIHYVHIESRKKMLSQGMGLFWQSDSPDIAEIW